MYFFHSSEIWNKFRSLRALVMVVQGVQQAKRNAVDLSDTLNEVSCSLDGTKESEFPSIQAWRQTYSSMGLKPTQYRCAAEAMLRTNSVSVANVSVRSSSKFYRYAD